MFKVKPSVTCKTEVKKFVALPRDLRSGLVWVHLMESLDQVGCIGKMFGWFPTCCVGGVVEALPLDQVEQPPPFAMPMDLAVEDPMDLPLVGVVQLNWWRWVDDSVGGLTRASGLQ